MLQSLSIRDVVLIDRLDLEFQAGLGVLTGETGAGKSILLDALGLALGARADSGLVRHGAAQAVVSADFALPDDHPARALLAEQGLDLEGEIVLRRVQGADGRSRAFVNDHPVSIGLLRRLGGALVEVQGQAEEHGLADPAVQRALLDAYGGLDAAVAAVRQAWAAWRRAEQTHREAEAEAETARAEEDFLRHAVAELEALDPQPGEGEALAASRTLLMNAEGLVEALAGADADLAGESGCETGLGRARRRLQGVAAKASGRLDAVLGALDRAAAEVAEVVAQLRSLGHDIEFDTGRLEAIEERLFTLREVARKHRVETDELAALRQDLARRLAGIDDRDEVIKRLAAEAAAARDAYVSAAEALSAGRRAAAGRLDAAVAAELPLLKLEAARFRSVVQPLDEGDWGPEGREKIMFEVATNPGTPPGPLAKIASGGELSRFMLILKVVLGRAETAPSLVFDEVDSDIGGATAAAVGERLARLAEDVQVLVVTHSPQVAARAGLHWRVSKVAGPDGAAPVTRVEALAAAGRCEEIARMLSGAKVTDEARAQAERLIQGAA
ncbi:MAG: DNA repair protein RecN [Kiloniellales bacterium]